MLCFWRNIKLWIILYYWVCNDTPTNCFKFNFNLYSTGIHYTDGEPEKRSNSEPNEKPYTDNSGVNEHVTFNYFFKK